VLTESEARLILFSSIEPADNFWSGEVSDRSALVVLDRIINGNHYLKRPEFLNLRQRVSCSDLSNLKKEIIIKF
jgi:hypothetical protein